MPIASIPTILLIAIVLNLLLMVVLVVSLRRRPGRGGERVATAGSGGPIGTGTPPGSSQTIAATRPPIAIATASAAASSAAASAPASTPSTGQASGPATYPAPSSLAPAPTRALPDLRVLDSLSADRAEGSAASAATTDADRLPAEDDESGDNDDEDGPESMSDTQPGRNRRFVLPEHDDERTTEAIEAFFSSAPQGPDSRLAMAGPKPMPTSRGERIEADANDARAVDPDTGLETSEGWSRLVAGEAARHARYRRPVSVVIAELDGLGRLADAFGVDIAERLIVPVADSLRRNARATDQVARLGHGRFAVLLPETDEILAINYVERVRTECDRWLASAAVAVRLSMGWASPAADGDLATAVRRSEERMRDEQRRPAPWWGAGSARQLAHGSGPGPGPTTPRTN